MIVALTVSGQRPGYLRRVLESWARVRGAQDARLALCCEPLPRAFPLDELEALAARAFGSVTVHVNERRKGCLVNTRDALAMAFAEDGFAAMTEEDIEVSDDILEYFAWARDAYCDDAQVIAACAHMLHSSPRAPQHGAVRLPSFNAWAWASWRDRWEGFILPGWGGEPRDREAWDAHLSLAIRRHDRAAIHPACSRSLHIGEASSLLSASIAAYMATLRASDCYRPHYDRQDYAEIPFGPELDLYTC